MIYVGLIYRMKLRPTRVIDMTLYFLVLDTDGRTRIIFFHGRIISQIVEKKRPTSCLCTCLGILWLYQAVIHSPTQKLSTFSLQLDGRYTVARHNNNVRVGYAIILYDTYAVDHFTIVFIISSYESYCVHPINWGLFNCRLF